MYMLKRFITEWHQQYKDSQVGIGQWWRYVVEYGIISFIHVGRPPSVALTVPALRSFYEPRRAASVL